MTDLSKIETIIVVMLENRSFDHMLGHLSLPQYGNRSNVDGLHAPLDDDAYLNPYQGFSYFPTVAHPGDLATDLPHESEFVHSQLNEVAGQFGMDGFVEAYYRFTAANQTDRPEPMGFLPPGDVPISTFLANEFAVCDRWFAPFPTSTQPNKIMALTGSSFIANSEGALVQFKARIGPTFFEWLDARTPRVPWRIYSCGISFLHLMGKFQLLGSAHRRPFERFADDFANEPADSFPKVIWIEPEFGDSPIHPSQHPCDNHPPLSVGFGEDFLRTIYNAITSPNGLAPARWQKTLMIATYDEHGGFFDHVPPIAVPYHFPPNSILPPGVNPPFSFTSTGLRVPTILVSPLVRRQSVCSEPMDHTSILQLLAQKYGDPVASYSDIVRGRRDDNGVANIVSVARGLNLDQPRSDPPPKAPDLTILPQAQLGLNTGPKSTMQEAFAQGAREMAVLDPENTAANFPGVLSWARATDGR